jgi:hypothetical protein
MLSYYFTTIQVIGNFMVAFLRKFNYVSYRSYVNGHFFLYWSFYWLVVRLLVKPWVLSFSYINELSLQMNPFIFTIIATVLSIILALIPTLFTSLSASLYLFLTEKHIKLLYENRFWMGLVCYLIMLEAWVMFSKTRRIMALLLIVIIFSMNFFTTNNPYFLFNWLFVLYTYLYHSKVVFYIFPDYPRSKTFPDIFDGSFYLSSLDAYYGVTRPSTDVKPHTKKNVREYHTSTKNLLPGNDFFSGNDSNTQKNSLLRRAAQFRVMENSRTAKLFQVQELPDSQLGKLGSKDWIHTDRFSLNYMENLSKEKSLGGNAPKTIKSLPITPRWGLGAGFILGGCVIVGGISFMLEPYPVLKSTVSEVLNSGQDLTSPKEDKMDDIDMYIAERCKK